MAHLARVQRALAALEAASTFDSSRQLTSEELAAFRAVQVEAHAAFEAGEQLEEAQAHAQARTLTAVVSPMPALERPLLRALRDTRTSHTAYVQILAAANVLLGASLLAQPLQLPAEAVAALAAAGSLLVTAGTPLISRLAANNSHAQTQAQPAYQPDGRDSVHIVVARILQALIQIGDAVLPRGQAPHAAARRALVKGVWAPRRLLPFLSAMVQAVEAPADDPEAAEHSQQLAVRLLAHLLVHKVYAKQQAALAADRPLLGRLVALLLHLLSAAARNSSSPAGRDGLSFALQLMCAGLSVPLRHAPMLEQLRRLLCRDAEAAVATVRDAAAALCQLPLQHASVGAQLLWTAHWNAAMVLSIAVGVLPGRSDPLNPTSRGPAPPPEVERPPLLRQAGQAVLDIVPSVAAAVAAMTRLAAQPQHSKELGSEELLLLYELYQEIILTTADVPPMQTADELLTWLAAADAMLRLLPVPAELAAQLAALPPGTPPVSNRELAAQLAHRCVGVFSQAACTAYRFLSSLNAAAQQAIADEALPGLVALHSRVCRLVHWSQSGSPQRSALVGGALPDGWPALANRVAVAFLSVCTLLVAKSAELEEQDALDSPLAQDIGLMRTSVCAAHLVAMAALARCMDLRCLLRDTRQVADSIARAAAGAPPLALLSPAWSSLLSALHQLLQEDLSPAWSLQHRARVVDRLLWTHRPIVPHVAAALLPCTAAVLRAWSAAPHATEAEAKSLELFWGMGGGSLGAIAKAHGEVFNQPGQAEAFVQQGEAAPDCWHACCSLVPLLPGIEQMAAELHTWQQQPEQLGPARLAAGRAAAVRACAFLGCPNVGAEGGMVAGQGAGAKRCGGCRSVWYCGPACSRADWKQHKAVCPLLRAEYERQAGAGGQ